MGEPLAWSGHRIKADIDALDKEARALEYRRKALDLRMKTIKGDWKQVVMRWERRWKGPAASPRGPWAG